MNKYEFDLMLARDMDDAIAKAEKNNVKDIKIKDCFLYKYLKTERTQPPESFSVPRTSKQKKTTINISL